MNKIEIKKHRFDLVYLTGAAICTVIIYGAYNWYHGPTVNTKVNSTTQLQDAQTSYLQGIQSYRDGNYQEAIKSYLKALEVNPHHVPARVNYALTLTKLGQMDQALEQAQQATATNTPYAPAYLLLGELYQEKNMIPQAKAAYEKALTLDTESQEAHLMIAQLLTKEGSVKSCDEAINHAQRILDKQPTNRLALMTLGDAHLMAERTQQARTQYQKALEISSDNSDLLLSVIGKTYERELNYEQAANYYQKSIEKNPNAPLTHVALAGAYFAQGDLEKGFQENEWRWQLSNMKNLVGKWDGSELKGKRIMVLSENSTSDILQYVRFAKTVKDRGAHVIVHAPKALLPLLKQSPYIDELVEAGTDNPIAYDTITSMQSIPAVARISARNLPNEPYLTANPQLVKEWRTKLAQDKNFKVGIYWQSDNASLTAQTLAPLAQHKNVTFYALQKQTDLKTAPFKIVDLGLAHDAFMDTAAVIKNMNLVIAVDSSIAHLAGALGVPTWIMLNHAPDARWMLHTSDSIWYPTAKLFRQPKAYDWDTPVKQVSRELLKKLNPVR